MSENRRQKQARSHVGRDDRRLRRIAPTERSEKGIGCWRLRPEALDDRTPPPERVEARGQQFADADRDPSTQARQTNQSPAKFRANAQHRADRPI